MWIILFLLKIKKKELELERGRKIYYSSRLHTGGLDPSATHVQAALQKNINFRPLIWSAPDMTSDATPETEAISVPAVTDTYFLGNVPEAFKWIETSVSAFYTECKESYRWNQYSYHYNRSLLDSLAHYHRTLRLIPKDGGWNDLETACKKAKQRWLSFLWSVETHKHFRKMIAAISLLLENDIDILDYIELPSHKGLLDAEPDLFMLVESSKNYIDFIDIIQDVLATEVTGIDPEEFKIDNTGVKVWLQETLENNSEALRIFCELVSINDFAYRFYHQTGELNGIPVISSFSNRLLSKFDLNETVIAPLQYAKELSTVEPLYLKNKPSNNKIKSFFHATPGSQKSISVTPWTLSDICTGQATALLELLPEASQKYTVLHLPNWHSSRSHKDPEFKKVTRAFCEKRKGLFFPILYNAEIRDENFELKKVYVFCFVLIQNNKLGPFKDTVGKFAAASNAMYGFISKYVDHDGMYFEDKKKYLAAKRERLKDINPFINIELLLEDDSPSAFRFFQEKREEVERLDKKVSCVYVPLADTQRRLLSSKPEPNLRLELKLIKIKKKLALIKLNVNSELATTKRAIYQRLNACNSILNYKRALFLSNQADLHIEFNSLQKYTKLLDKKKRFTQQKTEHTQLAYKENRIALDPFYENMFNDGIKILSVEYSGSWSDNYSSKDRTVVVDFRSELESSETKKLLNDIINATSPPIIHRVELLIDKPVKIYVNSKTSKATPPKVGGPYIVKIRKSSLEIKCKDKNSLYGYNGSSYLVHPHAQRRSDPFCYATACLGEAQSLLWNAFQQNCLKNIILAALTWVTSANSADTWGRDYKFFLDYKYIKTIEDETGLEDKTIITETEVNAFLGAETTEDIFDTEGTLAEAPVLGWLESEVEEAPAPITTTTLPSVLPVLPIGSTEDTAPVELHANNETNERYIAYAPAVTGPTPIINRNDDLY